jgi:hypothetical protein
MARYLLLGLAAAGMIGTHFAPPTALAEEDTAALARALPAATVTLQQGLTASECEGKPISGKYEIEDGALQLSVYTTQGRKFTEVIVDHSSGAIKKAEPITDAGDLKDAKEQNEAMSAAQVSLSSATTQATPEIAEPAAQAKVFGTDVMLAAAGRSSGRTTAMT